MNSNEQRGGGGAWQARGGGGGFPNFGLLFYIIYDLCSMIFKICWPKTIVWSPVLHSFLDELVFRRVCSYIQKEMEMCNAHCVHLYTDSVNLFSSTFEFKMAGYKVTSLLRCWGELPERWLYKPHPGGLPCTYRSIFEVVTSISKKFTNFIEKWAKGRGGPIKTSKNKWRKTKRNQCLIWRKIRNTFGFLF